MMISYPGAFVERSLVIATLTSATVNFLIGVAGSLLVPSGCGMSCLSLLAWSLIVKSIEFYLTQRYTHYMASNFPVTELV